MTEKTDMVRDLFPIPQSAKLYLGVIVGVLVSGYYNIGPWLPWIFFGYFMGSALAIWTIMTAISEIVMFLYAKTRVWAESFEELKPLPPEPIPESYPLLILVRNGTTGELVMFGSLFLVKCALGTTHCDVILEKIDGVKGWWLSEEKYSFLPDAYFLVVGDFPDNATTWRLIVSRQPHLRVFAWGSVYEIELVTGEKVVR